MSDLKLYGHPFSSYTQKVLIALYENDTPFEPLTVAPENPQVTADWSRLWPLRKFPVLVDRGRTVAESSIIIEHLQIEHGGPVRFIPGDPRAALDVRFLDRFFDNHVMTPMQSAVGAALQGGEERIREARASAAGKLDLAYAWLDQHLPQQGPWAAGEHFGLADCAAAPSLFYADWVYPIDRRYRRLRAYRARLLARPSFARAVDEARPYRHFFPLGAPDRD
jgi:glutathione S-transferase